MRPLLIALTVCASPLAAADGPWADGTRVVFLGDSNTFAGRFIAYLDAALIAAEPGRKIELLNLGLPSETVSGLSEPDHPYPRPNVHTRLAAVLARTKPNVVVACYGMNDGIYYPFAADRFDKYRDGFLKLIADCEAAGAKVVLMTPCPFDPLPLKDKVQPAGAEKYSWVRPYEKYDDVLAKYSEWLVTLRDKKYVVADAHSAVRAHLESMRNHEPNYRVSGDGIHPDANGHFIVFNELARVLNLDHGPAWAHAAGNGAEINRTVRLPFPRDPTWHKRVANSQSVGHEFGRFQLAVTGLEAGSYTLYEGDRKVAEASADQWKIGFDLGSAKELSAVRRSLEFWNKLEEKNRLLGLAWLTDVGHKRPDTPKGLPLAEAQAKASKLDAEARTLAKPVELKLKIVAK